MHRVNGDGDGSKMYGDGVGWKNNHADGVGMGLIFNTVSLFRSNSLHFVVVISGSLFNLKLLYCSH